MRHRIRVIRSPDEPRLPPLPPGLDGFLAALVQKFENCRSGLGEDPAGAEGFFLALYEPEREHLREAIRLEQPHLPDATHAETFAQVERLVRDVVIPGYLRTAVRFTARERNGFYAAPEGLHGLERAGWAVAGVIAGALLVWAPFVPFWAKESAIVLVFAAILWPDLRGWRERRRYERALNELVDRADEEVRRIDASWLVGGAARAAAARSVAEGGRGPGREA